MNQRLPKTLLLGLATTGAATLLWTAEQTTGSLVFELLTIPAKVALLIVFPLFLADLSSLLHGRAIVTLMFLLVALVVTTGIAAAYLPWRDRFCQEFSNEVYKWYYTTSPANGLSYPDGFDAWLASWRAHRPHLLELGILVVFYGIVVGGCYFFRFGRRGGFFLAAIVYIYLLFVPMEAGLIVWDYDDFLKGIAFDSISFDLFPISFWKAWDCSIFLYTLFFIFFIVSAAFFYAAPPRARNLTMRRTAPRPDA